MAFDFVCEYHPDKRHVIREWVVTVGLKKQMLDFVWHHEEFRQIEGIPTNETSQQLGFDDKRFRWFRLKGTFPASQLLELCDSLKHMNKSQAKLYAEQNNISVEEAGAFYQLHDICETFDRIQGGESKPAEEPAKQPVRGRKKIPPHRVFGQRWHVYKAIKEAFPHGAKFTTQTAYQCAKDSTTANSEDIANILSAFRKCGIVRSTGNVGKTSALWNIIVQYVEREDLLRILKKHGEYVA